MDNFAVKYVGLDNAHHLLNILMHEYDITMDREGTLYSGMTLKWDYTKCTCDMSMPGYVANNVLSKFQHPNPKQPPNSP
jgi:hypothetical protein